MLLQFCDGVLNAIFSGGSLIYTGSVYKEHTKKSCDDKLSSDIEKGGNTALFSKHAPSLTPRNEETHLFFVLCQMLGSPSVPLTMAVIFEAGAHMWFCDIEHYCGITSVTRKTTRSWQLLDRIAIWTGFERLSRKRSQGLSLYLSW